jgi:hypothetical protein
VTAVYGGDATHQAATSTNTAQLVVTQASPTIAATADGSAADSVSYGTTATLDVSGLSGTPTGADAPTGTITYTDADADTLCQATLPTTSCSSPASLSTGTYAVTASYSGDANYAAATAAPISLTVTKAPAPTITASVDHASSSYGTALTFSAAGVPSGTNGTVRFTDADGDVICTTAVGATSCTTSSTSPLTTGSYAVTATYSGDDDHEGGVTTSTLAVVIEKAAGAVTAQVNGGAATDVAYGDTVTFSAVDLPADAAPSSKVSFAVDADAVCTATVASPSCEASSPIPTGSYAVVATWAGDANYASATSGDAALTVRQASTDLGATADGKSTDTIVYGTAPQFAATGLDLGDDTAATGTVTFSEGSTVLCTATLPDISCTGPDDLGAGDHTVVATYSGDTQHSSATATAITVTVVKATADVTAKVNGGSSATVTYGTAATLALTGLPASATGTVVFADQDGDSLWAGDVADLGDAATQAQLPAGTYTISALYTGDANHERALADDITLTVKKAAVAITSADPGSAVFGTPVTLTVNGLPSDATGTVSFVDGDGTVLCSATLPNTSCATPATLGAGSHAITASYSGDANHRAASADPVSLTITKAETHIGTSAGGTGDPSGPSDPNDPSGDPVSATHGQTVTFTVSGLPAGATGTVEYRAADGTVLCTIHLDAGETSCTTSAALGGGDYVVTPVYSGDDDHAGSTGDPIALSVAAQQITIRLTASATSITWGDSATLTAADLPADATGTITFLHASKVLCIVKLPKTSCSTDAVQPGTATITAQYSGDASYLATSATTALTVTALATKDAQPAASPSSTSVTATWPSVPGATGYQIIVSTSQDMSDPIDGAARTAGANATSLVITGLDPNTRYYYRVIALGADGAVLGTHDAVATTAPSALAVTGSTLSLGGMLLGGMLLAAGAALAIFTAMRRRREAR